ncbi:MULTISPECIES: hypothetical protein [Haloarcula]|uniref:hypothetical protein n=1 Tax=Haloarcula TaxID=2237 RepID=UPI0023E7C89D|nr:hypothetical protein [Halomicroarcula sp. SHR3]
MNQELQDSRIRTIAPKSAFNELHAFTEKYDLERADVYGEAIETLAEQIRADEEEVLRGVKDE